MKEDEDLFLVIIENENGEDVKFSLPIINKKEQLDETEIKLDVEDIIETAEKHGQFINIETQSKECEYLEEDDLPLAKLVTSKHFIQATTSERNGSKKKRHKPMLKSGGVKSFVADLKDQYPELREDVNLLINSLAVIMRSVKPTPPPDNYYNMEVEGVYECTQCGAVTETVSAACKHYNEKHGPRYLMCYACGDDFRSITNLYKHEKRCTAPDAGVVLQARASCVGSRGRSRPFLNLRKCPPPKAPPTKFKCTFCSASFVTKVNLIAHECMHKGQRPFQCHICPAAYTSRAALSRHVKRHSNVEYKCDICGRAFKQKITLSMHMNTHQPKRKYGCELCDRRFAQKFTMKLHLDRVHRKLPPPCACQICSKRFSRMSLLKNHMKVEHGLLIMTPKMFFKKLPMLSSHEVNQLAKVVFRNDANFPLKITNELHHDNDHMDEPNDYDDDEPNNKEDASEIIVPDNLSSEEFKELLNSFQNSNNSNSGNQIAVVENSQIMNKIQKQNIKRKNKVKPDTGKNLIQATTSERNESKEKSHKSMLKSGKVKSFVADLKDQYPELRKDFNLLVSTLAVIMRSVNSIPPPDNYYNMKIEGVYECTQCRAVTKTICAARGHYIEKHGPRYHMCYACGDYFTRITNLYKHEKRCTAPDAGVVLQARASCIGSSACARPSQNLRKSAPPRLPQITNLYNHEKRCTAPDAGVVLQARASCIGSIACPRPTLNLRESAPPMLPQTKFNCTLSSASFHTEVNLTAHECMHKDQRPLQCHVCSAVYTSSSALAGHVMSHSNVEYKCDICGLAFKLKSTLATHIQNTHKLERTYDCELCDRQFAYKSDMKLHLDRVHRKLPPPCACQICSKRFSCMSLLKNHMKDEHGLLIMTQKMFLEKLPMLSSHEVQQLVKVVFIADTNVPRKNTNELL